MATVSGMICPANRRGLAVRRGSKSLRPAAPRRSPRKEAVMVPATGMLLRVVALMGLAGPTGTWVGQDGHDFVGPSSEIKPSDVQDLHFVIDGLSPARTIVHAIITGHGADEWQYRAPWGPWAAVLERAPRSRRADLYVEPARVETGRPFTIKLRYDDGTTSEFYVKGRRADPNLRMPGAALKVTWVGQETADRVGLGPSVGPDGLQDAHLALARLSPKVEIKSVLIEGPIGVKRRFGVNHEGDSNAELVSDPKDSTRADLFFQPDRDLDG